MTPCEILNTILHPFLLVFIATVVARNSKRKWASRLMNFICSSIVMAVFFWASGWFICERNTEDAIRITLGLTSLFFTATLVFAWMIDRKWLR
jgi:hypothetical protein